MTHASLPGLLTLRADPRPPGSPPDLRREQRLCTLFRTGKLLTRHGEAICRIRNISSLGFMADVCVAPSAGEAVVLELSEGRAHHATVAWSQAGRFGAEFSVAQPVSEILRASISPRHRHRALRLSPQDAFVTVSHETGSIRASIINISQTGLAMFAYDLALSPAMPRDVQIGIDGLDDMPGLLCWAERGSAGIQFERPLSFETFAHWLWSASLAARGEPPGL